MAEKKLVSGRRKIKAAKHAPHFREQKRQSKTEMVTVLEGLGVSHQVPLESLTENYFRDFRFHPSAEANEAVHILPRYDEHEVYVCKGDPKEYVHGFLEGMTEDPDSFVIHPFRNQNLREFHQYTDLTRIIVMPEESSD